MAYSYHLELCKRTAFFIIIAFKSKVANHVFGSVLCSPGCFSVYRTTALRDVLPLYSTGIDSAADFLTKDMGEFILCFYTSLCKN